jgi:hypothetical protein
VINVHQLGATVRLEDGSLAAIPATELSANRSTIVKSFQLREPLALWVEKNGRHAVAYLESRALPRLVDSTFEERMNAYLKSIEEWAPPDRPAPADRHFIRKKRRAAVFEARAKST